MNNPEMSVKEILKESLKTALNENKPDIFTELTNQYSELLPSLENPFKNEMLHEAIKNKSVKLAQFLIEKIGSDVNTQDPATGFTLLHSALQIPDLEVLDFLFMREDLNVNLKDLRGFTALDYVQLKSRTFREPLTIATRLLAKGGNINSQDQEGQTLLHIAMWSMSLNWITFLMTAGASPFIKDKNKKSPFDYAIENLKDKNFINTLVVELKKFINGEYGPFEHSQGPPLINWFFNVGVIAGLPILKIAGAENERQEEVKIDQPLSVQCWKLNLFNTINVSARPYTSLSEKIHFLECLQHHLQGEEIPKPR